MMFGAFPEAIKGMREEHDRVFGTTFDETVAKLRENPAVLNGLEYTYGAIMETLRFFPIGMSCREAPAGVYVLPLPQNSEDRLTDQQQRRGYLQGHTIPR